MRRAELCHSSVVEGKHRGAENDAGDDDSSPCLNVKLPKHSQLFFLSRC